MICHYDVLLTICTLLLSLFCRLIGILLLPLTVGFEYFFIYKRDQSLYLANRKSPKQQLQTQTFFHHLHVNCLKASAAAKNECIMNPVQIMHKELAAAGRHQNITQNSHKQSPTNTGFLKQTLKLPFEN